MERLFVSVNGKPPIEVPCVRSVDANGNVHFRLLEPIRIEEAQSATVNVRFKHSNGEPVQGRVEFAALHQVEY